jgi:hypothetical protein
MESKDKDDFRFFTGLYHAAWMNIVVWAIIGITIWLSI